MTHRKNTKCNLNWRPPICKETNLHDSRRWTIFASIPHLERWLHHLESHLQVKILSPTTVHSHQNILTWSPPVAHRAMEHPAIIDHILESTRIYANTSAPANLERNKTLRYNAKCLIQHVFFICKITWELLVQASWLSDSFANILQLLDAYIFQYFQNNDITYP